MSISIPSESSDEYKNYLKKRKKWNRNRDIELYNNIKIAEIYSGNISKAKRSLSMRLLIFVFRSLGTKIYASIGNYNHKRILNISEFIKLISDKETTVHVNIGYRISKRQDEVDYESYEEYTLRTEKIDKRKELAKAKELKRLNDLMIKYEEEAKKIIKDKES